MSGQSLGRLPVTRTIVGLLIIAGILTLFLLSGMREQVALERLRDLGGNPYTPMLIILAMTGAWTFALPGSMLFFVTPLLFSPWESTAILTLGSAVGSTAGYSTARWIGGPWVDRARSSRWSQFLSRHSSFGMIFALRIVPGSQHGIINYSAGALSVGFLRFLTATLSAISIKSFLYAVAIRQTAEATSIRDALDPATVAALVALAAIGVAGHVIHRRVHARDAMRGEK